LNEVYSQYYKEPYPARVAYAVAALPKNALAEVDVIAVK
jgi:2-iminobutanoate/2-iminopropanoate deaminase